MRRRLLVLAILFTNASCSNEDHRSEASVVPSAPAAPVTNDAAPAPPAIDAGQTDVTRLGTCSGPSGTSLRTLIIGNSNIYYWNLPKLLSDISLTAEAACPRIVAEGFTRGGQNLMHLWNEGDSEGRNLATTIELGKYDVVVIAESISLVELDPPYTDYVTYANLIIDAARASGARPLLYATPYVDQKDHFGFAEMATPQIDLAKKRSVDIACGGLAWLRVWKELPDVVLHHVDHAHPGPKGSFVSSLVLWSVITRGTPIGLTKSPPIECDRDPCPLPTPNEAEVFQRAAWEEVQATGPQ